VLVRVSPASNAPRCGRYPSRHRRHSGASRAVRRRVTARCPRVSATAGLPTALSWPCSWGRACRLTRVARSLCLCSRATRGRMGSPRGCASAAVRPPCRGAPPIAVANPIRRVACGRLCETLQGGGPGVADPSCPVHVAGAGSVCLSAPAPGGRLSRPPSPRGGSAALEAVGVPVALGSAYRRARAAARSTPCRLRPTSVSGVPRLGRMLRRPWARCPRRCLYRPGTARASHGLDASLHAAHARRGPRQPLGALPHASPLERLLGRSTPRQLHDARSRGCLTRGGGRAPRRSTWCPGSASPGACGVLPLLHRCTTREEWLVRPYSAGTCTLPEAPSCAWRTTAKAQRRGGFVRRPLQRLVSWLRHD
jgi:hypothetical protein